MTKFAYLAAAAVITSLAASPVLAKDAKHRSDKQAMKTQKVGKQARAQMPRQQISRQPTWRNDRAADVQYERRYDNSGFWPATVAAGIVGGAVNTAGAIATAPFRDDDAYDTAYDDSYGYSRGGVYRDDGFAPVSTAANIVGGAVNTAGAIATAPFRDTYAYDDSYAAPRTYRTSGWDNGWNNTYNSAGNTDWSNNWARRQSVEQGGFICTPGSYYTNSYGITQLCQ